MIFDQFEKMAKECFFSFLILFESQSLFRVFFEKLLLQSAVPIPPSLWYIRRPFESHNFLLTLKVNYKTRLIEGVKTLDESSPVKTTAMGLAG
jgi:hypothetical protein